MFAPHSSGPFCYSLAVDYPNHKKHTFFTYAEMVTIFNRLNITHLITQNNNAGAWYDSPDNIEIGVWQTQDLINDLNKTTVFRGKTSIKYFLCKIWGLHKRKTSPETLIKLLQLDEFKREIMLMKLTNEFKK